MYLLRDSDTAFSNDDSLTPLRIKHVTEDLDKACQEMRKFWPDCKVRYSGQKNYYSNINALILGATSFSDNRTLLGLDISGLVLEDNLLITVPISGYSTHEFCGNRYQADKTAAVIHPTQEEIACRPLTDVRTLQVTVNIKAYHQFTRCYLHPDCNKQATLTPTIKFTNPYGKNIASLCMWMMEWLNAPHPNLENSHFHLKVFEQRFIQSLVEYQAEAWKPLEHYPAAEPFYVKLAEELIRSQLNEVLNLGELARICGVSGRTLLLGFQKHRGYSPMLFWRTERLQAVRKEILKGEPSQNITQIAMKWGFSHFSRFSQDYQKQFHELPSQTRKTRLLNIKTQREE